MTAPRRLPTDLILELRTQGLRDVQIATLLGCHPKSVYRHIKPITNAKRARIQEAREWYAAGAVMEHLARYYGVAPSVVRWWVGHTSGRSCPMPRRPMPEPAPRRRCPCGGIIADGTPHHCWATGKVA